MENRRGSEIFLGVVGVATLLVAIIGATFAYFSATAKSGNEAISVQATTLTLGYDDDPAGLKTAMIPSAQDIATFAALDVTWKTPGQEIAGDANNDGTVATDEKITTMGECVDQMGNQVCSVYKFWLGNPSTTTKMKISGKINAVKNEFTNLKFAIYDERMEKVQEGTMPPTGSSENLTALTQELIGFEGVGAKADFNAEKPKTYTAATSCDRTTTDCTGKTNVREYTMIIWLNEAGGDNVAEAGKVFTAGITFDTGSGSGVTGVIGVANKTPTTKAE